MAGNNSVISSVNLFPSSRRSQASSAIQSTISSDFTGGREAAEARLFASLEHQHRSKLETIEGKTNDPAADTVEGGIHSGPAKGYVVPLSPSGRLLQQKKETEKSESHDQPTIKIVDSIGRTFTFPFRLCSTWSRMDDLIQYAFFQDKLIGPDVQDGHFDLIGPNEEIILPTSWEHTVQPGWMITMRLRSKCPSKQPPSISPSELPSRPPLTKSNHIPSIPTTRTPTHHNVVRPSDPRSYTQDLLLIDLSEDPSKFENVAAFTPQFLELEADDREVWANRQAQEVLSYTHDGIDTEDDVISQTNEDEVKHDPLLFAQIERLRRENAKLRSIITPHLPSKWVHVHRVQCQGQEGVSIYHDMPVYTKDNNVRHLKGRVRISEVDDYLEQNLDIAFVVFLDYDCDGHGNQPQDNESWMQPDLAIHNREFIRINCRVLKDGIQEFAQNDEGLREHIPFLTENGTDNDDDKVQEIAAPYLFYFHFRERVDAAVLKLNDDYRQQLQLLTSYIAMSFDQEYDRVRAMFREGLVSPGYLEFLFAPTEIVLVKEERDFTGYRQLSNPEPIDRKGSDKISGITFEAETWEFDGNFRTTKKRTIEVVYGSRSVPSRKIDSLSAYPLKYGPPGVEEKLRKRGEVFWTCRKPKYMMYHGVNNTNDSDFFDTRFMVDVATYWKLHGSRNREPYLNQLGDAMWEEAPPDGNFILQLPAKILGFNMQEKKWMDLRVDGLSPVEWNKKTFETLAIDADTKELITALVSNKLAADQGTDLIAGKGNGLILLLHGGPGTGKTLTAESVAEVAEMPLYRVTCGDLGIDPNETEQYLDAVFHLGKIWSCVVLLDEADVFLEQRTLKDLSRNALVSVFLRALEYYDGILILTSNRVGTFDEAFKSRIQLALHYESLNESQRHQIWRNFIHHLNDINIQIDTKDLLGHLDELAAYEMNGRQIRNALTTARQLALFKNVSMGFEHLKHVIGVSSKFDKYLFKLKSEATDEEWARDEGIR